MVEKNEQQGKVVYTLFSMIWDLNRGNMPLHVCWCFSHKQNAFLTCIQQASVSSITLTNGYEIKPLKMDFSEEKLREFPYFCSKYELLRLTGAVLTGTRNLCFSAVSRNIQ